MQKGDRSYINELRDTNVQRVESVGEVLEDRIVSKELQPV
jgi:hypothetical protein